MKIVCYGSLLNKESLAKTIHVREITPIWIKGFKKVYNLKPSRLHIYKTLDPKSNKVAVISLVKDDSYCSCAYIEVDDYEFEKLKIRERNYHTKKVPLYDFKTKEKIGDGIVFIGNKIAEGEIIIRDDFLPIPTYLERVRKGVYSFGKEFGKLHDQTSFLGDGRTITQYLNEKTN